MAIVTGDRYLDNLVKFVDKQAGPLLDGTLVLKLNPVGLHYVQSRLEALQELEALIAGAPVDYLRAYISDLGDHRALEQLRRILRLLTSLKVVSILPTPARDPTPLSLLPFGRLKLLELRGCDLSTSPARGLLQLRHTLEKIIVHNSTDALRHVFTSRIADINNSPVWNKLSLVSCPCNGLVLMDESLQLLPSVETLDLSRNRFAKVDNLRKCSKLKHLDLGFNHLRSISYLGEVTFPIVKLVLRNNALTSLRGIETLKSVEGLDLSYNVISSILELEILSSLPSLQSLWLEGNPICCAPWYRAQVFSLFAYPEKLKLDEKGITTRESWKRQIVLASRLKRPAGFGFYYPAKDNDEEEGNVNTNRKKLSRLALIADEEQMRCVAFEAVEQDSVSCESEIRSREESAVSDGEAEIVNLMNRVEFMKKEHSVLWLREFKEWMDQTSENFVDNSKLLGPNGPREENYMKNKTDCHQIGQSSRYASATFRASGDESNTNLLESDTSFGDSSIGLHVFEGFNSVNDIALESSIANNSGDPGSHFIIGDMNLKQVPKVCSQEQHNCLTAEKDSNPSDSLVSHEDVKIDKEISTMSVTAIDEKIGSHSSSAHPGSPPHYEEDILHRRHNLEEEFMQLSVDSYSLASSDSDTSVSDDGLFQFDTFSPEVGRLQHGESNKIMDDQSEVLYFEEGDFDMRHDAPHIRQNGRSLFTTCDDKNSTIKEHLNENHIDNPDEQAYATGSGIGDYDDQNSGCLENTKRNRRLKRRIVALAEENGIVGSTKLLSQKHNGIAKAGIADTEDIVRGGILDKNSSQKFYDNDYNIEADSQITTDEVIKNYFHENVADSSVSEDYLQSILCDCMLQKDSECKESKVVILLSSANKVYMLLLDATPDGSGVISEVVGSHRLEEIQRVDIGIALQVLRVHIKVDTTYLFMTKSVKKTREILSLLHVSDSTAMSNRCSLNSVEKVQVELFEKHICGGSNISIFLYSMLLFWCNKNEEESWVPRSLFVIKGYMIVCVEDLVHFSFDAVEDAFPNTYFSLDSCCPISDISEMVIEPTESRCVTLTLDSEKCNSANDFQKEKVLTKLDNKFATGSCQWKFKWFSEEILLKFVALLKTLHAETASYPLAVRCMS